MVIIPKHQKYGPLICVSIKNVNLYYQNFVYYWDENFWSQSFLCQCSYFVGNKAKGQISKRVFQENEARQIFRKTDIPYPMIRTCAYQGVRNFHFSENLTCFVFLKHLFWDSPFGLLPTIHYNACQYFAVNAPQIRWLVSIWNATLGLIGVLRKLLFFFSFWRYWYQILFLLDLVLEELKPDKE